MYKREVFVKGKKYFYYYHNIKKDGKVKNICLGSDLKKAKKKLKEFNRKKDSSSKFFDFIRLPNKNWMFIFIVLLVSCSFAFYFNDLILTGFATGDYFISSPGSYYIDNVVWETTLNGTVASDTFGASVASGDVNNDTYADVIVGATGGTGYVNVFFGTADGIFDMDAVNANITINGTAASDSFGVSVAVGDVNNDSYADVIVGATGADPSSATNAGQAYVFFGADFTSKVDPTSTSSEYANITINGTAGNDAFGVSVAVGDVNNDTYADVIVGANNADFDFNSNSDTNEGKAYVFFGADFTEKIDPVSNASEYANITINGTRTGGSGDRFGVSVASGDVNNDTYADVIVGASWAYLSGASVLGQVYVFFGADFTEKIDPVSNASEYANITVNGTVANDYFGDSVASGDVNNDSYADVIIGAIQTGGGAGQVYVFFGADFTSKVDPTSTALGYANITVNGTAGGDTFGDAVASGDVNNDTYADVIVGASTAAYSGLDAPGQVYVFFGADFTSKVDPTSTALGYANITVNTTVEEDDLGKSVAAGDVNNDSYADIIMGADTADPPGQADAGIVYIYAFDDVNPVVTLSAPADNSYDTDGNVNLSFIAVEAHPNQCTLWFRSNATNWAQNDSTNYSNNVQANIFANLTDAVYVWNVECNDTANNPAFASSNRTLTVDTIAPATPTITEPGDTSINPKDSISYTCKSSDTTAGIKTWTWTLTKPGSTTVTKTGGAVTSNSQTFSGDDTNLAGTYTVKCEVEDKAGWKSSSSKTFTVHYSITTAPAPSPTPSVVPAEEIPAEEAPEEVEEEIPEELLLLEFWKKTLDLEEGEARVLKPLYDIVGLPKPTAYTSVEVSSESFGADGRKWIITGRREQEDETVTLYAFIEQNKPSFILSFDPEDLCIEDCAWCYNNVKDYDETGIDCGGSCKPCLREKLERWELTCGNGICDLGEECLCDDCGRLECAKLTFDFENILGWLFLLLLMFLLLGIVICFVSDIKKKNYNQRIKKAYKKLSLKHKTYPKIKHTLIRKRKMNKKAQIYILAALLFAIVIYGLSTVPNVVKTYEFKGDFNKLAGNYNVESSKLINSVIISGGDVKESFTNFTTLFMSYSKAQNPNFGLIYSLNYEGKIRIGNYLKQKIKIDDGVNIIDLNGCFDKVSSQIIFNGLVLEMEAAELGELEDCFTDIHSTDKIWIGFEEDEEETIWYPFEIEQNRPQLMIVNLMEEGPQRQVSIAGEGYVEEEEREEEKKEEMHLQET